jgi:hypothetical protein
MKKSMRTAFLDSIVNKPPSLSLLPRSFGWGGVEGVRRGVRCGFGTRVGDVTQRGSELAFLLRSLIKLSPPPPPPPPGMRSANWGIGRHMARRPIALWTPKVALGRPKDNF